LKKLQMLGAASIRSDGRGENMILRLTNIRLDLATEERALIQEAARRLHIGMEQILSLQVIKKAVDARKSDRIEFVYTVDVKIREGKGIKLHPPFVIEAPPTYQEKLKKGQHRLVFPPVIVGSGPAGLFCALKLAAWGYGPLLLERGKNVDARIRAMETFWTTGDLDPDCNIQFGEGGAGTFSDGKLTTRVKDPRVRLVLEELVKAGAPEEIIYLNKPHIGTDILREVIKNLRKKFQNLGGQVVFNTPVTNIGIERGCVSFLETKNKIRIPAQIVVMAIGHSARDTYRMLFKRGVSMESKAFAMGVRVEHPQEFIDRVQYGKFAGHPKLGAADYTLAYQDRERNRGAYSFCMCPGGYVVGAASEPGGVVTNGMSKHARDSGTANSALVVTVDTSDFGDGCLQGMEFQRKWEETAFRAGGGNYKAPAQALTDFLLDRDERGLDGVIKPSYRPGVNPANVRDCLPKQVGEVLQDAIGHWDRQLKGFAHDQAVVTGIESRTSAPVRIVRNEEMESVNVSGLYPAGEGAGYAGGIVSAAVDGLKAAEAIITKYREPEQEFSPDLVANLMLRRDY